MFHEIFEFGPACFLMALTLAWQMALLLMVEKGIRGEICHAIHRYTKANNKYMKNNHKNKESSYLKYGNVNNLYGCAMSRKFTVNDFKWVEDIPESEESFVKNYNKESDEEYFLENDAQYSSHNLHNDFTCLPEKMKIERVIKLAANLRDKEEYVTRLINLKHIK